MSENSSEEGKIPPPLVVDFENDYQQEQASHHQRRFLYARSEEDAIKLIDADNVIFSAIFLNHDPQVCVNLIKRVHEKRAGTAVFLFEDEKAPYTELDSDKLAIHERLKKPVNIEEILKIVTPIIEEVNSVRSTYKEMQEHENDTIKDQDFVGVPIENYLSGHKTFFDLYIRLSSGRFLKLLAKGDNFSIERLSLYINKGFNHFYLKKEDQKEYVEYCDTVLTKLQSYSPAKEEIRLSHAAHFGEMLLGKLAHLKIDLQDISYADNFVRSIETLVQNPKIEKNQHVQGFLQNIALKNHAIGCTVIATLLMKELGIESQKARTMIGVASYFHDLGLAEAGVRAELLEKTSYEKLSEKDQKIYREHPEKSVEVLKEVMNANPAMLQAILQHHERRSGKGLIANFKVSELSPLAEIIGISDEFIHVLQESVDRRGFDPLLKMKNVHFNGFSFPTIRAFSKIFDIKL